MKRLLRKMRNPKEKRLMTPKKYPAGRRACNRLVRLVLFLLFLPIVNR